MTTSREQIVEIMAEAMGARYEHSQPGYIDACIPDAEVALDALSRAGFKIVSGEPVAEVTHDELPIRFIGAEHIGTPKGTKLYRESEPPT